MLGLDIGDRRIGVAVSDALGTLATPLAPINRSDLESDIDAVLRVAHERGAARIVAGLPLALSGRFSAQTTKVQKFVDALAERSSTPVATQDERMSTVEAERLLRQSGVRTSRDKGRLDSASAAVILQAYLDSDEPDR
jgi:putative Holliday junction resolvase